MFTVLVILASITAYLTVGYRVSHASWDAWERKDPNTRAAQFYFPRASRDASGGWVFGTRTSRAPAAKAMLLDRARSTHMRSVHTATPTSIATYKLIVALCFPVQLAISLGGALWYGCADAVRYGIGRLARMEERRLVPVAEMKRPPARNA